MKQLENASARRHISRLEALKLQIQQQAEVLYANQLDSVDAAIRNLYLGSYYQTAFEIQKGLGVGWTLHALPETLIQKVLSRPWTADGQTFRDRCWTNRQALVNSVNTQLTQMIIRGESPDAAIKAISHQFQVSRAKAGRLIMTESAAFSSAAQRDCYDSLGVERYTVVAAFDSDTCELCGDLDGMVFEQSDYEVGLTAPPFHPWCRCCTCPYFEDMEKIGKRWTRNPDGSTQKVPRDMRFEDWRAQFVQGPLPSGSAGATMTPEQKFFSEVLQKLPNADDHYKITLSQRFADGSALGQSVFAKYVPIDSVADGAFVGAAHFSPLTQKIKINFAAECADARGIGTIFFHEHGHYIDFVSCAGPGYASAHTSDFGLALRNDYQAYLKTVMKEQGIKRTEAYRVISKELEGPVHNAISDLFGGLSGNKCVGSYGHWDKKYWKVPGALENEAYAHMFAAQFSQERFVLMQKYFPSAFTEFENMLKGLIS